ncbi:MAG TPA: hypothetical protein VGN99_07550 [Steroidobacteraceae bacterium]|jgi:hypothetical protein|nr:hypothetical protein [Steroidobacteraceae bacterium]
MDDIADELGASPEWFPHELDLAQDRVSFIRLQETDYERASFLDARIVTSASIKKSLRWPDIEAAISAAQLTERCGFIFHIGHVGSTLLSRLVGAHPAAFSVREPMVLRTLAQLTLAPEPPLVGCLKLLSRTFEPRQLAVIKATSFVSELASSLVSRAAAPKAVVMFVSAESYFATILGGPNSRQEARMMASSRLERLHRRIGQPVWQLASLSEGEVLGVSWACEMSALAQATKVAAGRTLRVDFDQFIGSPTTALTAVLRHFDLEGASDTVAAILAGPDMRRYSKAPEHPYDAQLRRDVLNQARTVHRAEIGRGLAWLDRAAAQFDVIRDAQRLAG